ncbi:hypothetical protein M514_23379 [Trichuris suis]|uniref:RNA-directed DNA polymerase n=1 Tax=Trichuris suis TaxID=68888 RepID=A0A085N4F9_9BILA|nr:hypothetical protein M514_23379 [Trichuris suis]
MDTMIVGLNGTVAYLDDVLNTARKCHFGLEEVKYLGFIVNKHGHRPVPEKTAAIQRTPPPYDMPSLRSFIGLLSSYGVFVKEMRELRAPLDLLLKKGVTFIWSPACQAAFDKAKLVLRSELLLTRFDPAVDIVVAADASHNGLSAVILHRFPDGMEKPIAHASRSLLPAEKNHSQI